MGIFVGGRYDDAGRSIRPQGIIHRVGDVWCSRWSSEPRATIIGQHELARDDEADDNQRLSGQHLLLRSKLADARHVNVAPVRNKKHIEVRWQIPHGGQQHGAIAVTSTATKHAEYKRYVK